MKIFTLFVITFVMLNLTFLTGANAGVTDFRAIHENKMGLSLLEEERYRDAESQFLLGLTHDPFNPDLRYNLGVTYLLQKKFDRALKEFQAVLRLPGLPSDLAFLVNFNAAIAAQEGKDIDGALDFYQAALKYKPDSREVKVNIELLTSGQAGQQNGQGQNDGQNPQNQDQRGQDPQQNPQSNPDQQNQKPDKPQNFSEDQIKKILEELERQEQKVRALEYGTKGGREKGPGKDW